MGGLPEGVVTFVFTDIEGSTRLWDDAPDVMMEALRQHDAAIDAALGEHNGVSVKPRGEGDSRFLVFADAADAVCAVSGIQRNLAEVDWVTPRPIKVRASVHSGTADLQLGDYYGAAVNRAARLRAIAHGGQTLISASTWELVQDGLPDYVTAKDMGEHSLKDLTRPEHVFQLNTEGLETDFPELASLDRVPNNLPQQVTDFVGRSRELEKVKELIHSTRLMTVLAPGGTGKTRLAIQAAADLTSDFPDGVFFVSLAEVNSLADIVQAMAESIGIALSGDEEPMLQLLNYLKSRTQLLVLDNFEHVVDSANVVSKILESTTNIKVIVTSRAKLNVSGETLIQLGGLDVTWDNDSEALAISGVRLFLDAAKRAEPSFTLEPEDLDAMKTILRVTGGSPLAILLAAAWVDVLPLAEIAEEVNKSLDILESQMGDVPDRHRSIRAVFDYSWDLLTPDERSAFAALSIFRDGFTREAADRVTGANLRDLATLTGKSLITPDASKARYTVHELLRQFAHDQLSRDPSRFESIQTAHAEHLAAFSESSLGDFFERDQIEVVRSWEADLENLRTAWRFAIARADASLLRKLLVTLEILYELRGWYQAGADLWGAAIATFSDYSGDDDRDTVRALAIAADTYYRALLGEPDPTEAFEAVEVLRRKGRPEELFVAMQGIAISTSYLGRVEEMIEITDEMIALGETLPEGLLRVGGRNWRSLAAILDNDLATARELLPHTLSVLTKRHEYYYRSWTLVVSTMVANLDGDVDRSVELMKEQVDVCRSLGYRRGMMTGLNTLGWAQLMANDPTAAEHSFIESIAAASDMAITVEILGSMVNTARTYAAQGRFEDAVRLLSTVTAEPESAKQTMGDQVAVVDTANTVLDELRNELDEDVFENARLSGSVVPFETLAKELIDSVS